MRSPFAAWSELERRIQRADLLALFLDFDGTLAPIVGRPEEARMDKVIAKVLRRLARHPKVRMAVIGGRALCNLKKRIPLTGLYLAGSHGLEMCGPNLTYVHPEAAQKRWAVRRMAQSLRKALIRIPGALVEEKELSVAGHYRLVPLSRVLGVREIIRRTVAGEEGTWKVIRGKRVMEAVPVTGWNKGSCVTMLLSLFRTEVSPKGVLLPFYLGDDLTDQDGFEAVKGLGISVAVGEEQRLRADYLLKDTGEVRFFLEKLEETLGKGERR